MVLKNEFKLRKHVYKHQNSDGAGGYNYETKPYDHEIVKKAMVRMS